MQAGSLRSVFNLRQFNMKRKRRVAVLRNIQKAAVRFDHLARKRQSEPDAFLTSCKEWLENFSFQLFIEPHGLGVADFQNDA